MDLDRKTLITPSSEFHIQHLRLHNPEISCTSKDTKSSDNQPIFIVISYLNVHRIKSLGNFRRVLFQCSNTRLKSIALDLHVNWAFTI